MSSKEEEKKGDHSNLVDNNVRRSARMAGKEYNFDIDDILDQADQMNGPTGGKCVEVMLAKTYDPE